METTRTILWKILWQLSKNDEVFEKVKWQVENFRIEITFKETYKILNIYLGFETFPLFRIETNNSFGRTNREIVTIVGLIIEGADNE